MSPPAVKPGSPDASAPPQSLAPPQSPAWRPEPVRADDSPGRVRRVLLVTAALSNGGLERQLVLLARSLPPRWRAAVWSVDGGPYASVARGSGIPLRIAGRRSRLDIRPAFTLWRDIARTRPDVVHVWHWMAAAAALPACRALGIPMIDGSVRRANVPREGWRPNRALLRHADLVVANSRAGLEAFGYDDARGRVVYNAFDPERIGSDLIVPRRAPQPGVFTAVMAARMTPDKDYATLIDAARILAGDHDESGWRIRLVGSGPRREQLIRRARGGGGRPASAAARPSASAAARPSASAAARRATAATDLIEAGVIELADGGVEPLDCCVAGADAGVLMTDPRHLAEGLSNAIMEYMALGLPVVCADSGGNRELVLDGVTGFIVPPGDARAVADRLRFLRGHPDQARRMGQAGRDRVLNEFTVERMSGEWAAIYDEVAARRPRTARRARADRGARTVPHKRSLHQADAR